jgi:hypothetical protein
MWGSNSECRRFAGLGQPPLVDLSGLAFDCPRLRKQPVWTSDLSHGFLRRAMIPKPDKARVGAVNGSFGSMRTCR